MTQGMDDIESRLARIKAACAKAGVAGYDSICLQSWNYQGSWGDNSGYRVTAHGSPELAERAARWLLSTVMAEDRAKPRKPWGGLSTYGMQQSAYSVDPEVEYPQDDRVSRGSAGSARGFVPEFLARCKPTGAWIVCLYYYSIGD